MAETKTVPILSSIVVLGAMNPRLHFPAWYHLIGAISEAEATQGRESEHFIVMTQLARFRVADMIVTCTEDRWEIAALSSTANDRIIEVSCAVFGKLVETPISAYGFNNNFDLATESGNVQAVLEKMTIAGGFGFPGEGVHTVALSFKSVRKGGEANSATVQPSMLHGSKVHITHNSKYAMQGKGGYFDPVPDMRKRFSQARADSDVYAKSVVRSINLAK